MTLDLVAPTDLVLSVSGVDGFLEVGVLGAAVLFVDFGLDPCSFELVLRCYH